LELLASGDLGPPRACAPDQRTAQRLDELPVALGVAQEDRPVSSLVPATSRSIIFTEDRPFR
jgi:hypothetical protein